MKSSINLINRKIFLEELKIFGFWVGAFFFSFFSCLNEGNALVLGQVGQIENVKLEQLTYSREFPLSQFIGALNLELEKNDGEDRNLVHIYFFHSDSCSHCQSEMKLLDSLEEKYSNVLIYRYEVHEEQNEEILRQVQELFQIKTKGVPLTIIGDKFYVGYSEEKSSLQFIKAIEYYSRYGYQDRVGKLLNIDVLSTFKVDEDAPSFDEFADTYGNYRLFGSIYTDDLDIMVNSSLLGMLSQLNIIKIGSVILVIFLLSRITERKNKFILLFFYLIVSFLAGIAFVISDQFFTLFLNFIIFLLFIFGLFGYSKYKRREYMYGSIFSGISLISGCLENCFYYCSIFHELALLHNLYGLEKFSYYFNYIFIGVIVDIIMLWLFWSGEKLIQKRKREN